MTIPRLLIADDDAEMRAMMSDFLNNSGFATLQAANEAELRAHLDAGRVDLILLDVMLGAESGIDICDRLRAELDIPIIMISALSADAHRMKGYQVGADDYIAKPFNPDLLIARVRAVLKRARRAASLVYRRQTRIYRFAGWTYDGKHDEIRSPEGFQVALSRRETALLKVLLANPRIPLTRDEISQALDIGGDQGAPPGRAIDVLVGRLRSKIEQDPKEPRLLRTERGVGYVLTADVATEEG